MVNLEQAALFICIVEKEGLAAAGREMGLSPASVSEKLAALEKYYGVALLTRTTRAISLTNEGRLLLEGARRLVAESEDIEAAIRLGADTLSGQIRLSAPADFGRQFVVPMIDGFMSKHPDVKIDLNLTDSYVDLVGLGLDFAIRYGALADSSLKSRTLGTNRRVVCAAPAYLQTNGTPTHPETLLEHQCILMRFGRNIAQDWLFMIDGKPRNISVHGRRIANDGELIRQWCLQGHGIALKSIWDVKQDLATGALVEVLNPFSPANNSLQIVYPSAVAQPRRVRALMDFISAELHMAQE